MKREIIVDLFAGGGGASEGIRVALGRDPDIAINHDAEAICMHRANHPMTEHYQEGIWFVDPIKATRGHPVGLLWLSPDCTDFSKAKGGKPISRKRRSLAWVAVRWARVLGPRKPRVICLENVEEFEGWGPLLKNDKRNPLKIGATFKVFVGRLRALGYTVDWKQLRGCDYGAPTTRKRLFLIARCDGLPIVWPSATHGPGTLQPYRTFAECADFTLPCPSIFMTEQEAREFYRRTGIRIKRPLELPTLRRIGRGVWRYVIDDPDPFIVGVGGRMGQSHERSIGQPYPTITGKNDSAIVTPFLAPVTHAGDARVHSVRAPYPTITGANRGEHALVTPFLARVNRGERDAKGKKRGKGEHRVDGPIGAIETSNGFGLVAPTLIQTGYGERKGQKPRSLNLHAPLGTVVPESKHAIVAAFLAKHYGDTGQRPGSKFKEPMDTITPSDHHSVITSHLLKLHGSSVRGQRFKSPAPTIRAGGQHLAEVRAFLIQYYSAGSGKQPRSVKKPLPAITPRDRFALVTVRGVNYVIADIGMRMVTTRERFLAQGFRKDYIIAPLFTYEYRWQKGKKKGQLIRRVTKPLTEQAQGRMVGNSVCPPLAAAIVRANYHADQMRRREVA